VLGLAERENNCFSTGWFACGPCGF